MRTHLTILVVFALAFLTNTYGQTYERYKHLVDTTIRSTNLEYNKKLSITVPLEFQKDIDFNFPLIILFDHHLERMQGYTLHTIDYLTSTLSMPPSVIISVASGEGINRRHETNLTISDAQAFGAQNEQFIFNELIPFAQEQLNTSRFILLIGHSRYGYFTTHLLSERLTDLNAVISMSPFFVQKNVNLVDSLAARLQTTSLPHHVYYRFAIGNDYPDDFELMESAMSKGQLQHTQFNIKGVLFKEAYHNGTPGLIIAASLYDIFEYWAKNQNEYFPYGKDNISILPQLQDSIYEHYGEYLPFSMTALNGKGWEFFGEKQYVKAIKIWKVLLEQYPNLAEFYLYIASAQKELKQPYDDTLDKFLRLLKASILYSADEKAELFQELEKLKN
jgi:hypothetical protein